MSIVQACGEVEAAIGRARSLYGDASVAEAPGGATDLDRAAQTAGAARARTVGLSGHGIDAYRSVVDRSVGLLKSAAGSDRALAEQMRTAATLTQAGAARLDHIAAQTREISRSAAGAKTPAAQRIILTALRSQLAQTSQVVESTQQHAAELAGHIRTLHYPKDTPQAPGHENDSGRPNGIQAVDNTTVKAAPPPPPYPVNEVIAEATDLDGNRVVLRRGYYDANTEKGFGWDKAYWRHGVVNPNVFKDLISHSRPVRQSDGTLRYDVPINRVHCTRGPLGIANCEDTGENLTMRVVVDPRVGRVGVPDDRQKGVITMFPLPGGSGVIELRPKWTWTPPWVNNNVPIN